LKKYVTDKNILDKIGVTENMYAIYTGNTNKTENIYNNKSSFNIDNIDNSKCKANFETVISDYKCVQDYMSGEIEVYTNNHELIGIYDSTGIYQMESGINTIGYLGEEGKARCIALPQCKMMNSTIFDDIAEHKVYIGKYNGEKYKSLINLGKSGIDWKKEEKRLSWLQEIGFEVTGTHLSFDLWQVIGAVFGKALLVWRAIEKFDMDKMPEYMTIHISEIYESFVVNSKWSNLSNKTKMIWKNKLFEVFDKLNKLSMLYDLPDDEYNRIAYCATSILKSSWIKRLNNDGIYEPFAFKVQLKGNPIFDFCWKYNNNNPALVQIRPYDYDLKNIFEGKRGWNKCFHVIYASWLIQYRNYWKKRNKSFESCNLVWSQHEMLKAFKDSIFDIKHLSTDEMSQIMYWFSIEGVENSKYKRPAHIDNYEVTGRCELTWTLPGTLIGEYVLLKNEKGENINIKDSGVDFISEDVMLAKSRMNDINQENDKHIVTIKNRRINTIESVIYKVKYDNILKKKYIEDNLNGRCYSMMDGVQALKRKDRKNLLIDGYKVKEVDYVSLHPNMLYALNGLCFQGNDIYDAGNQWYIGYLTDKEAKKAVKMMMLRMINAKNKAIAIQSFKMDWNKKHQEDKNNFIPWLFDLYEAIEKAHKDIAHEFCTGKGTYLMNLDGKLIREVCWRLTREKICALAIHDSVIVNESFADKATLIMKEEYEKMFNGFKINVSCK
jgi:hypothetical protein